MTLTAVTCNYIWSDEYLFLITLKYADNWPGQSACAHTCMHVRTHARMPTYRVTITYTRTRTHTHTRVCVCVCVCVCVHSGEMYKDIQYRTMFLAV